MNNKNNYFLNSELSIEEKDKETAKFHILPVPLEKTVSYGKGTSNGPQAIIKASNELERYTGKSEPCIHGIHTHSLLNCNKPLKVIMRDIENIIKLPEVIAVKKGQLMQNTSNTENEKNTSTVDLNSAEEGYNEISKKFR